MNGLERFLAGNCISLVQDVCRNLRRSTVCFSTPFPPHHELRMEDSGCLNLASLETRTKGIISWKSFVLEN